MYSMFLLFSLSVSPLTNSPHFLSIGSPPFTSHYCLLDMYLNHFVPDIVYYISYIVEVNLAVPARTACIYMGPFSFLYFWWFGLVLLLTSAYNVLKGFWYLFLFNNMLLVFILHWWHNISLPMQADLEVPN